jgi:hypothetical protein
LLGKSIHPSIQFLLRLGEYAIIHGARIIGDIQKEKWVKWHPLLARPRAGHSAVLQANPESKIRG